mmetsp:Transcript_16848/g.26775  ORF Transcript_16848/g.26775 Transcript_16848/m.26775 type:complete len:120 (-) Transcript_16848:149-508(-)
MHKLSEQKDPVGTLATFLLAPGFSVGVPSHAGISRPSAAVKMKGLVPYEDMEFMQDLGVGQKQNMEKSLIGDVPKTWGQLVEDLNFWTIIENEKVAGALDAKGMKEKLIMMRKLLEELP